MSPASYRAAPPRVDCFGNLFRATTNNFTNVDTKAQTPSVKPIFWFYAGVETAELSPTLVAATVEFFGTLPRRDQVHRAPYRSLHGYRFGLPSPY